MTTIVAKKDSDGLYDYEWVGSIDETMLVTTDFLLAVVAPVQFYPNQIIDLGTFMIQLNAYDGQLDQWRVEYVEPSKRMITIPLEEYLLMHRLLHQANVDIETLEEDQ